MRCLPVVLLLTGLASAPAAGALAAEALTPVEARRQLRAEREAARLALREAEPGACLARDLPRGSLLTAADLVANEEGAAGLPPALCGKRSRRHLRAGSPLRPADFEAVPLVLRSRPVTAYVQRGALTVQVAAIALGDAGLGEPVRMRNPETGRRLEGLVVGHGLVRVAFAPGSAGP